MKGQSEVTRDLNFQKPRIREYFLAGKRIKLEKVTKWDRAVGQWVLDPQRRTGQQSRIRSIH